MRPLKLPPPRRAARSRASAASSALVDFFSLFSCRFSILKIITIIGLILLGIIITAGGVPGTDPIGFRFWRNPGPFQQQNGIPGSKGRFLSFWTTLVQAAFSYLGTEIVALTAGEAENPRRNVPKAIRRVFFRIIFLCVDPLDLLSAVQIVGLED